jgi:hypothetical protein
MSTHNLILVTSFLWLGGCSLVFPAADHQERSLQDHFSSVAGDGGSLDAAHSPEPHLDGAAELVDAGLEAAVTSGDGDGGGDGHLHPDGGRDAAEDSGHGDGDGGRDAAADSGDGNGGGDQDAGMCNGSPGGWEGCRGTGCSPCAELLVGYSRYTQNHPRCAINTTCAGSFFTCNEDCPAPTEGDR